MQQCVCSVKNIVFADWCLRRMRFLLVLVVALIGFSFSTFAQQATIVGTVTDPSGAVVPNVSVTITDTNTGVSRTIPTNDAGQYVAPDLQVGNYNVKAEAKGFKAAERKDIVVSVGDRIRVDFQMQMGAAQETVTVEAAAVHVQTDSGEVSNLVSGEEVQQLATNGRSIYSLTVLAPGASSDMPDFQVATPVGGNSEVSINGLRYAHNIYLLDGGEDLDRGGSGTISVMPSTDAIGEFRQLTSNYSAEYGLSSAGTMTMVIKSGTSQIHASAWEFNRNDAFDARNFFNPAPQKVAELRLNVWGFNVGGPVTFGHLYNPDKKKTFFFYNMEWRRLIQGGVINQTVPATSEYGGVFPSTLSAAGLHTPCTNQVSAAVAGEFAAAGQTLSTPDATNGACNDTNGNTALLQPFTGNTIPASLLSSNAQLLLKAGIFPAPNAVNAGGQATFEGGNNSPTNVKEEIVRLDHNFSSKFSVFGHFIAEQISQGFGTSQWSSDNLPTVGDTFGNPSFSAVAHTTYIISPTLVNEVAFNYNGNRINIVPFAGSGLSSLTLPTGYTDARLFTGPNNDDRIPTIQLGGATGANFDISSWPWHNAANDYQIRDDVSWTRGSHQFKMGGSWALYKKVQDLFGTTQGTFNFNGAYTGNDFADYLLGFANSYNELAVQDHGYWNNVSWALWFQDNWRVSRRLTLNLGVRWDGVPHTYEANDRMGNFYPQLYNSANAATFDTLGNICFGPTDPGCTAASPGLGSSPNPILANVPLYLNGIGIPGHCYTEASGGNFCVPKGLVNNHWGAVGPRIGFAYDVTGNGRTVVRGGFGVMYERIQGNDMYDAGPNIPFSLSANLSGVNFQNADTSILNGAPGPGSPVVPIVPAGINGLEFDNYNLPVSYQYSLGVQRSLTTRTVLSVAYVGNENRHQSDQVNINLLPTSELPALINHSLNYNNAPGLDFPGFNGILQAANEANSNYNALQVSLTGQATKDLQVQLNYTWSRSIDPSTGGDNGDLATVTNPYCGWKCDMGPSYLNRTNIFLAEFVYDLPVFRHSDNRFLKTALGGWTFSGIVTAESGLPIDINLGGPQGSNGLPDATNRPDQIGALTYPHTAAAWFNPAVYTTPTLGAFGNVGYDSVTGPGRDNWNLSLFKNFLLSESRGSRLELRLETFNTWNHTQFNGVSNTLSNSNFGQVTSAWDPRVLQLGGKIYF
jgi:hypothetical protein